jgi:hypothetical protein
VDPEDLACAVRQVRQRRDGPVVQRDASALAVLGPGAAAALGS